MTNFAASVRVRSTEMAKADHKRRGGQDVNLCYEARMALDLTQIEFGARTGRKNSIIHRREKGPGEKDGLGTPGPSQVLYRLILLMVNYGMKGVVMRVSDAIGEKDASEERLMADLTVACVENGHKDLVRLATKEINPADFEPSEALAEGFNVDDASRFLELMELDLKRAANKDPENAEKLLQAAGGLSGVKFGLLSLGAKKKAKKSAGPEPGGEA